MPSSSLPSALRTIVTLSSLKTLATSGFAKISVSLSRFTQTYSTSGWTASSRLAGNVQGVVVQTRK